MPCCWGKLVPSCSLAKVLLQSELLQLTLHTDAWWLPALWLLACLQYPWLLSLCLQVYQALVVRGPASVHGLVVRYHHIVTVRAVQRLNLPRHRGIISQQLVVFVRLWVKRHPTLYCWTLFLTGRSV